MSSPSGTTLSFFEVLLFYHFYSATGLFICLLKSLTRFFNYILMIEQTVTYQVKKRAAPYNKEPPQDRGRIE